MTKNESRRRVLPTANGSVGTPVDLRALSGSELQLEIDRPLGRPDAADVIAQDRDGRNYFRHAGYVSI
jgi:hypothetical protein